MASSNTSNYPTDDENWPRFLVLQDTDGNDFLSKLSPFAIAKGLTGLAGEPKTVKKITAGILVEVTKKSHALNLLKSTSIANTPIHVSEHRSLNTSKGVIRCRDIAGMSEEDICEELHGQSVTDVKRICRDKGKTPTNTYILTFRKPSVPSNIKIGYLNAKVDAYVPNPLRCYKCQEYGHGSNKCSRNVRCSRCSKDHSSEVCSTEEPLCCHCSGKHPTSDRNCPRYLKEKEIVTLKYKENISFPEARRLVESTTSYNDSKSYAAATQKKLVTTRSIAVQTEISWPKNVNVTSNYIDINQTSSISKATSTADKNLDKSKSTLSSSKSNITKPVKDNHPHQNTPRKPQQAQADSPRHNAIITVANKYDALTSLSEIPPTPPKQNPSKSGINLGERKSLLNRSSFK